MAQWHLPAEVVICISAMAPANMLVGGRRLRWRNGDPRALKRLCQLRDTGIEITFPAIFQRHIGGHFLGITRGSIETCPHAVELLASGHVVARCLSEENGFG